jgi:hypothetical protein
MELSSITSSQVAKLKSDSSISGEIVGWSTSDYGAVKRVTIRKCVNEEFVEETFDAKDLDLETDMQKTRDVQNAGKWVTMFYATDTEDEKMPEYPMSHCKLMHTNKAKDKNLVEDMIRDLLNSPMPHMHEMKPNNIKIWAEDKSYLGSYNIEHAINITKVK